MLDPLKELKVQEQLSERIWSKLFGGEHRNGDFVHDGQFWRIGNGVVRFLENDGSLDSDEKLNFLKEATFYADQLSIKNGVIRFVGNWKDGVFEGDYFYTTTNYLSTFEGGFFKDGFMQHVKWDTHPARFVDGKIRVHPKFGLLGVLPANIGEQPQEISILALQKAQYLIITDEKGEKKALKLLKNIDENNSDIIVTILPEEKTYKIKWGDLRKEYKSTLFKVGHSVDFAGVFKISNVEAIEISDNFYYQPEYKEQLSLSNIKQFPTQHEVLNFNLGASKKHRDLVLDLKNKINQGIFGTNLVILKSDIDTAVQAGEASDLGDFVVKAKAGKITGLDKESLDAIEDITSLVNLTKKFINPQIGDRLFKEFSGFLKPKLKFGKKPSDTLNPPSVSGQMDPEKKSEYLSKFLKMKKK